MSHLQRHYPSLSGTNMHHDQLLHHRHAHVFLGDRHGEHERRTWAVVALTATMMVVEIIFGYLSGSLALLADGWHMATHAGALGLSAFAYWLARRHANDARYAFGTGKIGDLAGFSSALLLGIVAIGIAWDACHRLLSPNTIAYAQALPVAIVGLLVNLLSLRLLHHDHHDQHPYHDEHDHDHDHDVREADPAHQHGHADHNLRAAYVHVLADAVTSVGAIAALALGWRFGWVRPDALVGLAGSILIAHWAWKLMRDAAAVLLDRSGDPALAARIRSAIEDGDDRIYDLHVWRLGPGHYGVILGVVSDQPLSAEAYRAKLSHLPTLSHVTVETRRCEHAPLRA